MHATTAMGINRSVKNISRYPKRKVVKNFPRQRKPWEKNSLNSPLPMRLLRFTVSFKEEGWSSYTIASGT